MLTTPHFHCAAGVAWLASTYHRITLTRTGGVWVVKVQP